MGLVGLDLVRRGLRFLEKVVGLRAVSTPWGGGGPEEGRGAKRHGLQGRVRHAVFRLLGAEVQGLYRRKGA